MASYGCLHAWAGLLGDKKAAGILEEILGEEKAANDGLSKLALTRSNEEALDESDKEKSDDAAGKSGGKRAAAMAH
jgi:ferritin-like metal-binding protein YciE